MWQWLDDLESENSPYVHPIWKAENMHKSFFVNFFLFYLSFMFNKNGKKKRIDWNGIVKFSTTPTLKILIKLKKKNTTETTTILRKKEQKNGIKSVLDVSRRWNEINAKKNFVFFQVFAIRFKRRNKFFSSFSIFPSWVFK